MVLKMNGVIITATSDDGIRVRVTIGSPTIPASTIGPTATSTTKEAVSCL